MSIRSQLIADVKAEWDNAVSMFPKISTVAVPDVGFFEKGTTAGKAWYSRHLVEFNVILAEQNRGEFINTVKHEIAHIITRKVFPYAKQAHGPEFKSVFRSIGGNGQRYHSYDVSSVKSKYTRVRMKVTCSCKTHLVTRQKHAKIAARPDIWFCKLCKSNLKASFTSVTI